MATVLECMPFYDEVHQSLCYHCIAMEVRTEVNLPGAERMVYQEIEMIVHHDIFMCVNM